MKFGHRRKVTASGIDFTFCKGKLCFFVVFFYEELGACYIDVNAVIDDTCLNMFVLRQLYKHRLL